MCGAGWSPRYHTGVTKSRQVCKHTPPWLQTPGKRVGKTKSSHSGQKTKEGEDGNRTPMSPRGSGHSAASGVTGWQDSHNPVGCGLGWSSPTAGAPRGPFTSLPPVCLQVLSQRGRARASQARGGQKLPEDAACLGDAQRMELEGET